MDYTKLKRKPESVKPHVKVQRDNTIIVTKEATILVPKVWEEKGMVILGNTVAITGVYALVIGDAYAVSLTAAFIYTDPDSVKDVVIDGEPYLALHYQPGDRLALNTKLVRQDPVAYKIYDVMLDKGKIPWFITYDDLGQIFDTFPNYAGVKFNVDHAILEMCGAVVSRQPNNRNRFYRHGNETILNASPAYVPMRSVQYGASNTTAKLTGAYWDQGLASALVDPSDRKEIIEDILRK